MPADEKTPLFGAKVRKENKMEKRKSEVIPVEEDFDTLEEDWNIIRIEEDKTILKHKLVLIRIIREKVDEKGNPAYGFSLQKVFGVIPPKELRGQPSTTRYSPEELSDSIVAEDMKFEAIKESWNKYRLKNGVCFDIKPIVTMVSRTDKFDERGDPIYFIQSQEIVKGKIPKEVKEELRAIAKEKKGGD